MAQMPGLGGSNKESQKKIAVPSDLTPAQIDKLLSRLSDAQVRQLLRERLHAVAKARKTANSQDMFDKIAAGIEALKKRVPEMIESFGAVPSVLETALNRLGGDKGIWLLLLLVVQAFGCFAIGYLAELAFRRLFFGMRRKIFATPADAPRSVRLFRAAQVAFIWLLFLGVFAGVSAVVFLLFFAHIEAARMLFETYFLALVAVRLTGVISRFILSPYLSTLRFETMSDEAALYLHKMVMRVTTIVLFGLATAALFELWGLPAGARDLILIAFAIAGTGTMSFYIFRARKGVANAIRRGAETSTGLYAFLKGQFAGVWHIVLMLYFWVITGLWAFQLNAYQSFSQGATIALVLVVPICILVDRAIKRTISYREVDTVDAVESAEEARDPAAAEDTETPPSFEVDTDPEAAKEVHRNRYGIVIHRIARILLILAGALIVLSALGVDLFASLESSVGARIAAGVTDTLVVIIFGYIAYEATRAWFDRRMAEEEADAPRDHDEEAGEGAGAPRSRLATLLPIFRGFVITLLVAVTAMLILSNLDVNIGPLLAGAGIIGVAIGFGSQALVRDIVSGTFFLIDDAFRVGEYVEVGPVKGTVEKISIRSMRLRHHRGLVHTLPYGEIKSITNYSRDWVIMKLEFRLPYGTDIEIVRKLIKKTGQAMEADPNLAKGMLAPLKSQGVVRMEDSALIFRAKFTAKPGEQFVLRREAYRRIQETLLENGIGFAHQRVTVKISGDDKGDEKDRDEAVAAAGAAAAARRPSGPSGQPA